MGDYNLIKNKLFSYMVNKAKKIRKSFRKSKEKISSDDILDYNRPRNLSNTSIDLESITSTTSSSKTYIKSNSSNYSKRDNSLDLVRTENDDSSNHEIVLPYQRFGYVKNKQQSLKCSKKVDSLDLLRIKDDFDILSLHDKINYNK